MKTIGIIAEYNPFHNGHTYQIQEIKQQLNADTVVIVMSGNFVQRGTPAWCDKYLRTRMALAGGADFVFELPVVFATSSAEFFAHAGIALLDSLGFVDGICFGSEEGTLPLLEKIAKTDFTHIISRNSPQETSEQMKTLLKQGHSYPSARTILLQQLLPEYSEILPDLLAKSNNILGIEYLKAILSFHSKLIPYTIRRTDSGYHSQNFSGNLASASAIRNYFRQQTETSKEVSLKELSPYLPESTIQILFENQSLFPIENTDFSSLLYYKLRTMSPEQMTNYADISSDLARRIENLKNTFTDTESFITNLKTKQYTHSRISRALFHLLLDIKKEELLPNSNTNFLSNLSDYAPYARLLGMRRSKSQLLRKIPENHLITKVADADKILKTKQQQLIFEKDILAADLYRFICNSKYQQATPDEYRRGIIMV